MGAERLQKVLAEAGVASRRGSESLIAAGRVTVDGRVATIGERVDPAAAEIAVDGRPIGRSARRRTYLALHKPAGVTSTARDRHAARTVVDLVPPDLAGAAGRLYPVGRLDRDSEGLIFLTNDGAWTDRVLHPSHGVEREYAVGLAGPLDERARRVLEDGIRLDEGLAIVEHLRPMTRPETDRLLGLLDPRPGPLAWYRATLRQGWKRQLRRMFAAVGWPVARLVRVRVGTVRIDGLRSGESRPLSAREAASITQGIRPGILGPVDETPGGPVDETPADRADRGPVVALDGPGSSGKSSVGAAAAHELGYRFCDTGLFYRAVTWLALERGVDLADAPALTVLVAEVALAPDEEGRLDRVLVDGRDVSGRIRTPGIDERVSEVARVPAVRSALLGRQRALAAGGGIIMAGRDIGTVVLPDADVKLYLDASAEERARRRAAERGLAADDPEALRILADLRRRDGLDSSRPVAPLRAAPDAVHLVTDGLALEETVALVVSAIRAAIGRRRDAAAGRVGTRAR